MYTRLLTLALLIGAVSLGSACNRSRDESHDRPASMQQGDTQAQQSPQPGDRQSGPSPQPMLSPQPGASSQPGQIPQAQESPNFTSGFNRGAPIRPAGDPNVIAPPRTEPTSSDWGESAGIAAGHTK